MRRSEWLVRVALAFCLLYGVMAIRDRHQERFPFFAWELFSSVPNPNTTDFSARLISGNGLPKKLPVYYENSNLQNKGQEIQGFTALQRLGKSIESGAKGRAALYRKDFESTYLKGLPRVQYQIVMRTYNSRERVKCATCYKRITVIANYTTG